VTCFATPSTIALSPLPDWSYRERHGTHAPFQADGSGRWTIHSVPPKHPYREGSARRVRAHVVVITDLAPNRS
jgi:hypothetical protein